MRYLSVLVAAYLLGAGPVQAELLQDGEAAYKRQDYVTALRLLEPLAMNGDAFAQYRLGRMYGFGHGVVQDFQKEAFWLRKAADQGNADAQFQLGLLYEWGTPALPKDLQETAALWHRSADQGHASAQVNLASMYERGEVVPKDYRQALHLYRQAADQGLDTAQFYLGRMYANGQGVPKDDQQAYFWWLLSGASGNTNANRQLLAIESRLTPQQRATAQAEARSWSPRSR